jgi:hypothetical protein
VAPHGFPVALSRHLGFTGGRALAGSGEIQGGHSVGMARGPLDEFDPVAIRIDQHGGEEIGRIVVGRRRFVTSMPAARSWLVAGASGRHYRADVRTVVLSVSEDDRRTLRVVMKRRDGAATWKVSALTDT